MDENLTGLEKTKSDALRLLSFRPRSADELRRRLRMKRHPAAAIDEVIALLRRQGLVDDEKFAKLLARSRVLSRPVGKRQLEIEMQKKGLSGQVIAKTLGELGDYDEKESARELVRGRFLKMKGLPDEKKKARLFGFLKRRGYPTSVIFSVLADLFKNEEINLAGEASEDENG